VRGGLSRFLGGVVNGGSVQSGWESALGAECGYDIRSAPRRWPKCGTIATPVKRVTRILLKGLTVLSAVLCVAMCVFWVRGRSGYDTVQWMYDRWLADGSAASNWVVLTSERRVWLNVSWGQVGPPTGQLVWGYYMNANDSGGRPRLRYYHGQYDPMHKLFLANGNDGTSGWGPARWQGGRRSRPKDGDDHRSIRIGMSHWVLAVVLAIAPARAVSRFVGRRRRRGLGLCAACGYDLRATPERCPECGMMADS
jgi:hypothetical protein